MAKKPKLELTWSGKENRPKLEPRILIEDPAKSYHTEHRVGENDIFDNSLIFSDNLLAHFVWWSSEFSLWSIRYAGGET